MEEADMVIVGAGFAGLAMARTYLMLNPATNLVILDAGTTVGGVWAGDRLYPYLRTVSQLGHFEYSDFPMRGYDVAEGEHMRGEVMQQYLQDYASAFDLTRRTRLNTVVREAEDKGAAGWLLTVQTTTNDNTTPQHHHLLAAKLVVATGLTSTPSMPTFADQSTFTAPLLHSRDFGRHAASILGPAGGSKKEEEEEEKEEKTATTTIAVLSGNKSACDVVYAACAAAASPDSTAVHWILRASGHGPCWMAPARTGAQNVLVEELITTRLNTWLASPCIWGPADGFGWVRRLLDRTAWGRALTANAAKAAQEGLERRNGYGDGDGDDEMAKLRPWSDAFWIGTGRGLLNYGEPGLLDYVREGRVRVHVADVDGLGPGAVIRLSNGEEIAGVDALVCCTGWRHEPSIRFVGDDGGGGRRDIAAELGLPHAYGPAVDDDDDDDRKAALVARADDEILSALPRLRDQPPPVTCPAHHLAAQRAEVRAAVAKRVATAEEDNDPVRSLAQAYTLYRFMVPPSRTRHHHRRTIAFIGCTRTASTALMAQTQALWLSAFFMGRLPHLDNNKNDDDTIAYESILHARQNRWRHPLGFGPRIPDFTHDALPYMDLLLRELGLPRWRKRCSLLPSSFCLPSLWREVFEWYGPADYRGLVEEWAAKEEGVVLRDGDAAAAAAAAAVGDEKGIDGIVGVGRRRRKATPLFSATNGAFLVTAVLGAVAAGAWIGTGRRR